MSDLNREERLQIMLTPDELRALDDWRFARRMPSRAAAVRELLKRGLQAEGWDTADGSKSGQYGVMSDSRGSGKGVPGDAQSGSQSGSEVSDDA